MKTFRLLTAALVAVAFATLATADDKKIDAAKLVGKWEPAKKAGTVIEMMKDGKMSITHVGADGKKDTMEGTYSVADSKLKVKYKSPDGNEHEHTVTIKSLDADKLVTVDEKEKEEEFKKVK